MSTLKYFIKLIINWQYVYNWLYNIWFNFIIMYISKFFSFKLCLLSLNICFNCENTRSASTLVIVNCLLKLIIAGSSFKSTSFPFIESLYSFIILYPGFLSNTNLNFSYSICPFSFLTVLRVHLLLFQLHLFDNLKKNFVFPVL